MAALAFPQVTLVVQYGWVALLPPVVWFLARTRIIRTAATIIRVTAWDCLLRRRGVPISTRRKLIAEAAQRDLESS